MSASDFDERELRIAPVMTGGTSLAVWMGGATAELHRLLRSRIEVDRDESGSRIYRGLLEATRTRPVVDVITGTSAGGLNGTLLGAACVLGVPVDRYLATRQTWLDLADLDLLIRPSSEPDPPSLLKGDDRLMGGLRQVLQEWRERHGPVGEDAPPVDMVTTVTTVVPEPRNRLDHFGESMAEVDHAQWLRFTSADFRRDDWVDKLSLAARTSASIPGVFEPSFLPVGARDARRSGRPDLARNASFRASRWAVDGGVVVNLPLGEALDRIFDQSADVDVRRVVLYVCPTPAEVRQAPADADDARPTLRGALATVVTAPRAEGVSGDVDQLERHNSAVERQVRVRRTMANLVDVVLGQIEVVVGRDEPSAPPVGAVGEPFALYRAQRAASSVRHMIERVQRAVGPLPLDPSELEAIIAEARTELVPERIDQLAGATVSWGWGIAPVEEAVSIALGLIGRTQRLVGADTSPEARALLTAAKLEVHEARAVARAVRDRDDRYWRRRFAQLPGVDPDTGALDHEAFSPAALLDWARTSYDQWPVADDEEARLATFIDLAAAHLQVANAIRSVHPAIVEVTRACGADVPTGDGPPPSPTNPAAAFAQAVLDESLGLFAAGDDPRLVQRQLLRVHVAQTLLLGEVESREQRIDLMQLSWNAWNALDPERRPADKLAGPELARLGAFLKPSWRANDWFWGRMDAAHRLLVLLLDPSRLAQLYGSAEEARTAIEAATGVQLPPDAATELDYLDHLPHAPVPTALQATARAMARVVQTEIARAELPLVADAVRLSQARGANTEASSAFAASVPTAVQLRDPARVTDDEVAELVRQMHIGTETVGPELGFALMNRAISRGVSVTVNAVSGRESGLPLISSALRPLRAPLQAVNSLVSVMTSGSRLARGATAFILATAGAIVALRLVGIDVPSGTFAVSVLLFVGAVAVAMLRSGFVWLATVFVAVSLLVGLTLVGAEMAEIVWSTEAATVDRTLPAGTEIELDGPAIVRITRGEGEDERIDDVEVDGAVVVLRGADGVVRGEPATDHVAGWKRWGFIATFSVARVVLALVAVAMFVVAWRGRERSTAWRAWCVVIGGVAAAGAVAVGPLAERALTGRPPVEGDTTVKSWIVDIGERLEGYGLEIVLLVVVGVAIAIALGGDLAARRWFRRRVG